MRTIRASTRFLAVLAAAFSLAGVSLRAADTGAANQEKENGLIETLRSGPRPEKALACKQLAIYGTKRAVPELAPLLADEQLASWARIALEAIPDPAAGEALRKATEKVQGKLLVGVINSIGIRRDKGAVVALIGHLKDQDVDVAAAAAVALGRIGTPPATDALVQSLGGATGPLQSYVAEGCILAAEQLAAHDHADEAAKIYHQVRAAKLPKQKLLEATRGEILTLGNDGIPLLVEQIKSPDKRFFQIGLMLIRESTARGVASAVAAELPNVSPERAALLLHALADRGGHTIPPTVVEAAKNGSKPVRIAAVSFLGRRGDASSVATLLLIAADADKDLADAARIALGSLRGAEVDEEIAKRLNNTDAKLLPVLIELAGQRRISATPALVKALDSQDGAIRRAALVALGNTVGPEKLSVLVAAVVSPKEPTEADVAKKALLSAAIRMPDRDACSTELAAAMDKASPAAKAGLLEIIGAVGGQKALDTIAAVMKSGDPDLQDIGSRALGQWLSVDAAPVLLEIVKTSHDDKLQARALRGYIRLARQFATSPRERADMCQTALGIATRPEERKLVLTVLGQHPSVETLAVAIKAREQPALKKDADQAILKIAQKLAGKSPEADKLLAAAGIELPRVQIIKAEYGAGATLKDVTEILQARTNVTPQIALPSPMYNESFGGDPAPNVVKQLRIQYRINGKAGEATFAENAPIDLPMPK